MSAKLIQHSTYNFSDLDFCDIVTYRHAINNHKPFIIQ